jgi:hypothetical protein
LSKEKFQRDVGKKNFAGWTISVPNLGTYVSKLGTGVSKLGTYVPKLGTENSQAGKIKSVGWKNKIHFISIHNRNLNDFLPVFLVFCWLFGKE